MKHHPKPFHQVGLYTRLADTKNQQIIEKIIEILANLDIKIYTTPNITTDSQPTATLPLNELAQTCSLIIAIGGDGSILDAARHAIHTQSAVLGVNRGHTGFLADLPSDDLITLQHILLGDYIEEKRHILAAFCIDDQQEIHIGNALNEILLTRGDVLRILDFDLYINDSPICHYRADGMIISTPTGSTAYSLSAGGAIIHPELNSISLVPLNPHSLNSRPIVLGHENRMQLVITQTHGSTPYVLCDGHSKYLINPPSRLEIRNSPDFIRIIHPSHYTFFETLKTKLHWEYKPYDHSS